MAASDERRFQCAVDPRPALLDHARRDFNAKGEEINAS
jgi:hypothetical protein